MIYIYRIKSSAMDDLDKPIFSINKDFMEEENMDFFAAKNAALSFFKSNKGEEVAKLLTEAETRGLREIVSTVDIYMYFVEVFSDGREVEYEFSHNIEMKKHREGEELERRISRLKRKEINERIAYTLIDYQEMTELDPAIRNIRFAYHVVKVNGSLYSEPKFAKESLIIVRHHDLIVSRIEAIEKYRQLVQDTEIQYSELGIANFDYNKGTGYVPELYLYDAYSGKEYKIYTTLEQNDEDGLIENRKREQRIFNYYGFEFPFDVMKETPWD